MCIQSPLFTLMIFSGGCKHQPPLYTLSGFSLGVQPITNFPLFSATNSLLFQACGAAFNDIAEAPNFLLFQAHGFRVFNHILPKLPPSCIAKEFQSFTISPCAHKYVILALTVMIITFKKISRSYVSSTKSTCFHYHPMV
jgi:hypothetical protein